MIIKIQLLKGYNINVAQVEYCVPDGDGEEFFKKLHQYIKRCTDNLKAKENEVNCKNRSKNE